MSLVRSLAYVGVSTTSLSAWREFAHEGLGIAIGEVGPGGQQALRLDDHAARIILEPGEDDGLAFLGWEVADATELTAASEALTRAGCPVVSATDEELAARHVEAMVWTTDPSGWRVELAHGPVRVDEAPVFGHGVAGFATGSLGVGHVVLQAPDPSAALAFYREVLGFSVRDRLDEVLWFLGCNPRHHSIGIADIGGPARPLHLMVEVIELDDLGAAFDRCIDRGDETSLLGLHSNDRMLSFYVRTPSGFEIEYGWNGLLVDDDTWVTTTIDRPSVWGHRQLDAAHPPTIRPFHARYRR